MIESMFIEFAVAQDGGEQQTSTITLEGNSAAGNGGTQGEGGQPGASPSASSGGFSPDFFMILMLVIVAMIGFSFMSQRKQKKRQRAMLEGVGKRAVVQTIGGIIGTVVDVRGDRLVLSVHEGTNSRLTVARSAIQQTLEVGETASEDQDEYDDQDDQDDLPDRNDEAN